RACPSNSSISCLVSRRRTYPAPTEGQKRNAYEKISQDLSSLAQRHSLRYAGSSARNHYLSAQK
ncbi:MAG: hypothetical protein P8M13_02045, partial [Luminiphilus sp.]|nr:hypothetical protein [Luminiphilus sp.]